MLAVHERVLDRLLKEFHLFEVIQGKGLPCEYCHCNVKRDNLGFIYFEDGRIKVCCEKLCCYYDILRRLRESKE